MAFLGQMRKAVERREMENSTKYQIRRSKKTERIDLASVSRTGWFQYNRCR